MTTTWIGVLLLLCSGAAAGKVIELPCGYTPGTIQRYRFLKTSIGQTESGPSTNTLRSDVTIEVESFDGTTSVLRLLYGPVEDLDPDPSGPGVTLVQAINRHWVQGGFVIRYATNHATRQHTILNLDDYVAATEAVVDAAWSDVKASNPAAPDQLRERLRHIVTPAILTKSVADDLNPLVDYTCGSLRPRASYETVLENTVGGPPFPATGTVRAVVKDDEVHVTVRQVIDDISGEQLEPYLRSMFPEGGDDLEEWLESVTVEKTVELEVVVDARSGWATEWRSEGRSTFQVGKEARPNTDTVECTRLDDQSG